MRTLLAALLILPLPLAAAVRPTPVTPPAPGDADLAPHRPRLRARAGAGPSRVCTASFYGVDPVRERLNTHTANGEVFDPGALTAAMWDVPFDTQLRVSVGAETVTVRVNDRGPARRLNRCVDLTPAGWAQLGLRQAQGLAQVTVEVIG